MGYGTARVVVSFARRISGEFKSRVLHFSRKYGRVWLIASDLKSENGVTHSEVQILLLPNVFYTLVEMAERLCAWLWIKITPVQLRFFTLTQSILESMPEDSMKRLSHSDQWSESREALNDAFLRRYNGNPYICVRLNN